MDIINTFILPVLSSAIAGLLTYLLHNKIASRRAQRIHRRQLTGLIDEIKKGMIQTDKKSQDILLKRLKRIVDTYDIAINFKPKQSIKDGKKILGAYHKEKVGDE